MNFEEQEFRKKLSDWLIEKDTSTVFFDDETEEADFVRKSDLAPPSSKNNNEIQLNGSLF